MKISAAEFGATVVRAVFVIGRGLRVGVDHLKNNYAWKSIYVAREEETSTRQAIGDLVLGQ